MQAFLKNVCLRPLAMNVNKNPYRESDNPLADFGVYKIYYQNLTMTRGTSLLFINSEKEKDV